MLRPQRISGRGGVTLILALILNTPHPTNMAGNEVESPAADATTTTAKKWRSGEEYLKQCPQTDAACGSLQPPCIECTAALDCVYGELTTYSCNVKKKVVCSGTTNFERTDICRFCFQTEEWEHKCIEKANCNSVASPLKYYVANCTVSNDIICLGQREFPKRVRCAWSGGARWSTALVLALTLGGFGADRFYLGHWQEGIGKLFSFGGLGVWTLVDALLIAVHHLGPADGSLYL